MKYVAFMISIFIISCTSTEKRTPVVSGNDSVGNRDTGMVVLSRGNTDTTDTADKKEAAIDSLDVNKKEYSNQRFKEVTVERTGPHEFKVKGKGQIFEASFGWVIEDGHEKLQQGYTTTDAGAPEWGNFSFVVNVEKKRPNSTLHLVLFETSAKDGSRQYELAIPLF